MTPFTQDIKIEITPLSAINVETPYTTFFNEVRPEELLWFQLHMH
jgi:hypothetical protein